MVPLYHVRMPQVGAIQLKEAVHQEGAVHQEDAIHQEGTIHPKDDIYMKVPSLDAEVAETLIFHLGLQNQKDWLVLLTVKCSYST